MARAVALVVLTAGWSRAYSVRENLVQHVRTLRFIAETGKPFEPNVPHHFGFRGADRPVNPTWYPACSPPSFGSASVFATSCCRLCLNTPRRTWGTQDLAKCRALLGLARELEDSRFRVILQPRAGLDYLSSNLEKAKEQLAAVTELMDDIEPENPQSPEVIHVVSYSEGSHLADPAVVNESIRITRAAITSLPRAAR